MINIKDYISTIDKKLLYKIGGMALLYIVFCVFFFFPAVKDYGTFVQKKKENKAATQKALKSAEEYTRLSQERLQAEVLLRDVSSLIATEKEVKNILNEISQLATQGNVKILEIVPQDSSLDDNPLLDEYCDRQGLQIDLECEYHQLAKFIETLETYRYAIEIISMRMIPGENLGKKQLARIEIAIVSKKKELLSGV
jgi:Tfp pilus assembly protein PilO